MLEHIALLEFKCRVGDDERDTFESKISSLQMENDMLKEALASSQARELALEQRLAAVVP